jgi:hypothetical protein
VSSRTSGHSTLRAALFGVATGLASGPAQAGGPPVLVEIPLEEARKNFTAAELELVRAIGWDDSLGSNRVTFAQRDRGNGRALVVEHTLTAKHATRVVRTVKDQVEECEFDVIAQFLPASVTVTDVNRNGIGEVSFAYRVDCVSDVSPVTQKLLVLESGKKHILRGTSRVFDGVEATGGGFKAEGFGGAARVLRKPAEALWKRVMGP